MTGLSLAFLLFTACRGGGIDGDADGFDANVDCNDNDAAIHPGAAEVCDGVDQDCDGSADDGATDGTDWFLDSDGDGYGSPSNVQTSCETPSGYVADATDCNDGDPDYHPGAVEADCTDPNDYNCDGSSGYADADGDGYPACSDCNDGAGSVNPDADEACDGLDNDCDGVVDEPGAVGSQEWFADNDADGFGWEGDSRTSCTQPDGYVGNDGDCNDSSALALPGGVEVCDGLDNDCDGVPDDDASDATVYYADTDGDGFGASTVSQRACQQPAGFVDNRTDCDDGDSATYPGAPEACDLEDNDCDAIADEGLDGDGDGITTCEGDCDDGDADVFPGADELCNGSDDDCDGAQDEGAIDVQTWYIDYDGDGFGNDAFTLAACTAPTGFVATSTDCDDLDDQVSPGAAPGCDGLDHDCDGQADNDADLDGYSDILCGGDDCDDQDPLVVPDPGGGCAQGTSCADILDSGLSVGTGVYTIDPDGFDTGIEPFDVLCDMDLEGGGWTLLGKFNLNVTGNTIGGRNWRVDSAVNTDYLTAPDDDGVYNAGHLSRAAVAAVVNSGERRVMTYIKQHSTQMYKYCENHYQGGIDSNWSFTSGSSSSPGKGSCGQLGWGSGFACGATSTTCASHDANYTMDSHWMHANGLNSGTLSGVIQTYCGDNATTGIGHSTSPTGVRRGTCLLWGK